MAWRAADLVRAEGVVSKLVFERALHRPGERRRGRGPGRSHDRVDVYAREEPAGARARLELARASQSWSKLIAGQLVKAGQSRAGGGATRRRRPRRSPPPRRPSRAPGACGPRPWRLRLPRGPPAPPRPPPPRRPGARPARPPAARASRFQRDFFGRGFFGRGSLGRARSGAPPPGPTHPTPCRVPAAARDQGRLRRERRGGERGRAIARDETRPVSTVRGTRRVRLVRGARGPRWGAGAGDRSWRKRHSLPTARPAASGHSREGGVAAAPRGTALSLLPTALPTGASPRRSSHLRRSLSFSARAWRTVRCHYWLAFREKTRRGTAEVARRGRSALGARGLVSAARPAGGVA